MDIHLRRIRQILLIIAAAAAFLAIVERPQAPARPILRIGAPGPLVRSHIAERIAGQFERDTGIRTVVVPTIVSADGRGRPIDVVFSSAQTGDERFVSREPVIAAEFVIVGPGPDPADVSTARSPAEALQRIWTRRAPFRRASAGTAVASVEDELWAETGLHGPAWRPSDTIASALRAANATGSYMLIDRLSYEHLLDAPTLTVLYSGGAALEREYVPQRVAGEKTHSDAARAFVEWWQSQRGRAAVQQIAIRR